MRKFIEKSLSNAGMDREGSEIISWFITVIIYGIMIACLGVGLSNSNDPKECRVTSIANTVLSFPYVLGCNLGKDRWNIKINPEIVK